LAGTF
jgi:uncharacterized protein YjbJ (UPF0337 family)